MTAAVIGSGGRLLAPGELDEALRGQFPPETRRLWVRDLGGDARVAILTKARHGGEAAARLADFLAEAAPAGWLWAEAVITAEPHSWVRRWPMLAVHPAVGEEACAEAAKTLAQAALTQTGRPPADDLLELLRVCGLTLSAGKGK